MASILTTVYDRPIQIRRTSEAADSWQAVRIYIGETSICVSLEEATQLAADLLNVAGVTPVAEKAA